MSSLRVYMERFQPFKSRCHVRVVKEADSKSAAATRVGSNPTDTD